MYPVAIVLILPLLATALSAADASIPLWPGPAPGEKGELAPERDTTKPTDNLVAGRGLIRLGNVSTPTLTVYRPAKGKANGTAVLVSPAAAITSWRWIWKAPRSASG